MIKLVSKKNKPLKLYKAIENTEIFNIMLFAFTLFFICLFLVFKINIEVIFVLITLGSCFLLYCIFNTVFEVYETNFSSCLDIIILPYKIVLKNISFEDIVWLEGKEIKGHYLFNNTSFVIYCYLKNGKRKNITFPGKESDFFYVINNYKNIGNK